MSSQTAPSYTTRVGNAEIVALSDGRIRFAPSDFFPTVSAAAWEPYRADLTPQGDMIMNLGCFAIRSEGKTILIDTGLGSESSGLATLEYARLPADMQAKGVGAADVDIVGITHLHVDHVGWNFVYGEQDGGDSPDVGSPMFPNARYWVSNADWRVFTRGALGRREYVAKQVRPLQERGLLDLFEGERQLTGEVSTLPTPGHTPGHTSFLIASQGERAVITGDAIHARAQAQETHWSPRADSKPDLSAQTRQELLARIERDNAMLISGHFPAPGFGALVRMNGKRYWQALS